MTNPIQNAPPPNLSPMVTWSNDQERKEVFSKLDYLENCGVVQESRSNNYSFRNIDTNISAQPEMNMTQYGFFRPGESVPTKVKDAIRDCMLAYERVGLVRNVIDLMSDFGCRGVKLVHPVPKIQRIYERWFEQIKGKERSERFLNMLYRSANVVITRYTAKVPRRQIDLWGRSISTVDLNIAPDEKVARNEIPWEYTILNPLTLEIVNPELCLLSGEKIFGIRIPAKLKGKIKNLPSEEERKLVDSLPARLVDYLAGDGKATKGMYILPPESTKHYYYKKDDWMLWAFPMIYSILDDVILLTKMKMADFNALDGAVQTIRTWTLGDLELGIAPTAAGLNKLSNMLATNVAGGTRDVIWGPDLKMTQTSSDVHQFLGSAKYEATLNLIYAGLGIPSSLTGAGANSGFTNNFIALKTLIERLEYGRNLLTDFWRGEIKIVQEALGFKKPAEVHFETMSLSDETAEKKLLIDLADRDLISTESLLEKFHEVPEVELRRVAREYKLRKKKNMPNKAGPFHNPQILEDLTKIFAQTGEFSPPEFGVELQPKPPKALIPADKVGKRTIQIEKAKPKPKPTGLSRPKGVPGRRVGAKDKEKRKKKVVKPRRGLSYVMTWANSAQQSIAKVLMPALLDNFGHRNARELTDDQFTYCENAKFGVLLNLAPFTEVTDQVVYDILANKNITPSHGVLSKYEQMKAGFREKVGHSPTVDDCRQISAVLYSLIQETPDV